MAVAGLGVFLIGCGLKEFIHARFKLDGFFLFRKQLRLLSLETLFKGIDTDG